MKKYFSFIIILICKLSLAFDPVIIQSTSSDPQDLELLKRVLITNFKFPERLVIKRNGECVLNRECILQLCIDQNHEVQILHMNRSFIRNNFADYFELRK